MLVMRNLDYRQYSAFQYSLRCNFIRYHKLYRSYLTDRAGLLAVLRSYTGGSMQDRVNGFPRTPTFF
jgi:hypothetical protein